MKSVLILICALACLHLIQASAEKKKVSVKKDERSSSSSSTTTTKNNSTQGGGDGEGKYLVKFDPQDFIFMRFSFQTASAYATKFAAEKEASRPVRAIKR